MASKILPAAAMLKLLVFQKLPGTHIDMWHVLGLSAAQDLAVKEGHREAAHRGGEADGHAAALQRLLEAQKHSQHPEEDAAEDEPGVAQVALRVKDRKAGRRHAHRLDEQRKVPALARLEMDKEHCHGEGHHAAAQRHGSSDHAAEEHGQAHGRVVPGVFPGSLLLHNEEQTG
eukprot:CAMPEP_0181403690 /NCGR_PEP_ID=MMETSP1110-20121109/3846_1 /TAXON_ID=174948 /ORGANISM="Symbiodinium sp., Strain CCMP421" /LENGTH=172 /DNA_ID=CAMNT_0023525999 /DNA_START=624 /DNA_END=1143 /DNA_ORIENTATION=+